MLCDDDNQSFFPPKDYHSLSPHRQRLKRLKKSFEASEAEPTFKSDMDELLGVPRVDFAKLEALEAGVELEVDDLSEPSQSQEITEENELNSGFDGLGFNEQPKEVKRALDFGDEVLDGIWGRNIGEQSTEMDFDNLNLNAENAGKKRIGDEVLSRKEGKKKKQRGNNRDDDDAKPKQSSFNRRDVKERKAHLHKLHADSQRLLRETSDASFKPMPLVQKPVSSVLEKIRQRKLEVSKKIGFLNNSDCTNLKNGTQPEVKEDLDFGNVSSEGKKIGIEEEAIETEVTIHNEGNDGSSNVLCDNGSEGPALVFNAGNANSKMESNEEPMHSFRAPLDDTQDLLIGSQTSDCKDDLKNDFLHSDSEEVMAPSALAMNLKFDSVLPDDISSDEDNDKENVDPHSHLLDERNSPLGDFAKTFVDDEAVEEDDSDHDLSRFHENEDDFDSDSEDLNNMIASEYEERPTDKHLRNELHQKWQEQQDAIGTDCVLRKLNYGSKDVISTLLNEVEEVAEDEADGENEQDLPSVNPARINQRKAKQIITQMFSDKDVTFLSDDDEEVEKTLAKRHILDEAGEQATLQPPAVDESSREIFGLIKKLNTTPKTKKKAKTSFFDSVVGGKSYVSSKSSFLGRPSNHSLPSSHRQTSGRVRSFIFERDDSSSRSSASVSEDSSNSIPKENHLSQNSIYKSSTSQFRYSQRLNVAAKVEPGTSLFEILKQSSIQSNICNQDSMPAISQTMFNAFKIPRSQLNGSK